MASPPGDLTALLSGLAATQVEFVLVEGLAAVEQGAPITTHDVDIVPKRSPENIERLRPTAGALLGPGHSLLTTALGPLDVLGTIEEGRAFEDLLAMRSRSALAEPAFTWWASPCWSSSNASRHIPKIATT